MRKINPAELAEWISQSSSTTVSPQLVDVREPWEFERCHLPGAVLIPMGEILGRLEEIDAQRPVVCICHHGSRSMQVAHFLESQGLHDVCNLTGGVEAWALQVDPQFPRY